MLENLKLERPIAFIDVETTGLSPFTARIVELSILKIQPGGNIEYKSHKINPEIPIPAETTAIHNIDDADVKDEPTFRQYAKGIRDFLDDCDIAGFNVIKFDLPILEAEFRRASVDFSRQDRYFVDCQVIFHQREPRNLAAAYLKYCGKEMLSAHSAEEDARVSAEILQGQLLIYQDLPRTVAELSSLCYKIEDNFVDVEGKFIWTDQEVVCNFGKNKGQQLRTLALNNPDFLKWIIRSDFSTEVKRIAADALTSKYPIYPNSMAPK